ncbi:class I SAM-dependent methyltransferase [Candidatus Pacearchaeota archaeon]|jgi:ubiquinone/menaquinone biosynthesis C-methylase UbiE|nr:class I SAM-dependent methyltransferase [Candidatus Pacearchaeota archaeon]
MKTPNQQEVWDKIAYEWNEFKKIPSELSEKFLEDCTGKVLDMGSGSGRHLTKIKDGKMYLVDFSERMIELAKEKAKNKKIPAEFFVAELTALPFEDNFFDYGISISSLHCLKPKEHKKAVKELFRVMKPNSKVLVGVWNFNSKRFNQKKGKEKLIGWQDKGKRYYYLFEEDEIHKLFKEVGFKIISTHNSGMMINFIAIK